MTFSADALERSADALAALVSGMFDDRELRGASDDAVLSALAAAARIHRSAEALMVDAVARLVERSGILPHAERPATRRGCRSMGELIQRVTRVSQRSAAELLRAAAAVQEAMAPTSGELLPADLPQIRMALGESEVGIDGVAAVAGALRGCGAGPEGIRAADEELAAAARGLGADGSPPASADELRACATVWAMYLDQDGVEPRDARALRKRGVTLGRIHDGLVSFRGNLLPEVAAQLERGFHALLNPKVGSGTGGPRFTGPAAVAERGNGDDPDEPIAAVADTRSRPQKQHDALATALTVAATSAGMPALGGAAPTLVVSVREEDLVTGRGYAHVSGSDEPLSLAAARQVACSGAIQRVVTAENGRIVSLSSHDRVFNHHQRRAIALRDGGCLIPGCSVPAEWCEIHHVTEYSRGGPTHTDNGVLLCWHHHRTLDTSGWKIRMQNGVPYVRGPAWWDSSMRWRPATTSPTRKQDIMARRR